MGADSFTATVRRNGDAAVIDMQGEVNSDASLGFDAAYDEVAREPGSRVVLNFRDVDYINSTGIALIVQLLGRAQSDGRAVLAYGLSDHYKQIFDITHLSDFIPLFGDEDDALASVSGAA